MFKYFAVVSLIVLEIFLPHEAFANDPHTRVVFNENCNKINITSQHFEKYSFFYFGSNQLTSRNTCMRQKSESDVFHSSSRWICYDYFQEKKFEMFMGGTDEYDFSSYNITLVFADGKEVKFGNYTPYGEDPSCPFFKRKN
jgi:hypothetical protein